MENIYLYIHAYIMSIYNVYLLASSIIVPTQLYLFSPNDYNQMSQISWVTNLISSSQKVSDTVRSVSDTGFWRMATYPKQFKLVTYLLMHPGMLLMYTMLRMDPNGSEWKWRYIHRYHRYPVMELS